MASLNIAEWSPEQVSEWLSGVDGGASQYASRLKARGLDGTRLLALRCDDLHYLGVHIIGHQELLLEAVEQLRHFHYEMRRECVQQLAVRVSVAGAGLARALRGGGAGGGGGGTAGGALETQALADVARLVSAVKPLACWLSVWPLVSLGSGVSERKAALLKVSLEAATCAQRDRFADQPARAIAAAAAAAAHTADYIIQDVSDPGILTPASLESVCVAQGDKPLGFALLPSACQRHQLVHVRFGSPAHASGQVHDGDEIVAVGEQCVVGWGGEAIEGLCRAVAKATGELPLKLRRRGARPPPPARPARLPPPPAAPLPAPPAAPPAHLRAPRTPRTPHPAPTHPARTPADPKADSSDESDALSPPASPVHLHLDHTRMYGPKPGAGWGQRERERRHTVSGGSPLAKRASLSLSIEQFWRELREQRWGEGGGAGAGGGQCGEGPLYRHKAVSCSTGLELSPRPRTCLGTGAGVGGAPPAHPLPPPSPRGRLDKSHSTPAYSLEGHAGGGDTELPPHTPIPESPTIEVNGPDGDSLPISVTNCIDEPPTEALNPLYSETSPMAVASAVNPLAAPSPGAAPPPPSRCAPPAPAPAPSPPPRPAPRPHPHHSPQHSAAPLTPVRDFPALKIVPRQPDTPDKEFSPLKPLHNARNAEISLPLPLRHLAKLDLAGAAGAVGGGERPLPPLNQEPEPVPATGGHTPAVVTTPEHTSVSSSGGGNSSSGHSTSRGLFPSAKTRSLKKKNSLLAKRRSVAWRTICGRGAASVGPGGASVGGNGAGGGGGGETAGAVWQRVRAKGAALPRWARRYLLLVHNVLYAYRSPECQRADCMIQLAGWVVCEAGEVRSRAHAFKVYHTGRAAYFAADTREAMAAWIHLLTRATLAQHSADPSQQYSETDYSETESDAESTERHEREKDGRREKDKDKSKFGSLKKLTSRMSRSESSEAVGAASLDRKYLRIFSRKPKIKATPVPVPTEHYRSYRRVCPSPSPSQPAPRPSPLSPLTPLTPLTPLSPLTPGSPVAAPVQDTHLQAAAKLKAARYAHVSNPNLAGAGAGAGAGVGAGEWRAPPSRRPNDHFLGFVTLEEFMLKKQEEERKQVYTNRVLMGIERPVVDGSRTQKEIQKQLDKIVPDVIYGELPDTAPPAAPAGGAVAGAGGQGQRALPPEPAPKPQQAGTTAHGGSKPISIKGKDGYEKIVYPEELHSSNSSTHSQSQSNPALTADRWRDSLRRNHKVHSGGGEGSPRLSHLSPSPSSAPAPAPAPSPAPPAPAPASATSPPNAHNTSDSSGSGAPPGGVSRLRLMFSSRSTSRDHSNSSQSQLSTPSPQHGHAHQHNYTLESTSPSPESFPSPRRPSSEAPHIPLLSGGLSTATYPHLQCPPTFQPETYCLSRPQPRPPHTPHARRHQHKQ